MKNEKTGQRYLGMYIENNSILIESNRHLLYSVAKQAIFAAAGSGVFRERSGSEDAW